MYKKKQFLPEKLYIPASEKVPVSRHCKRGKQGKGGVCIAVLTDLMATQESLSNHRKHLASCRIRPLQVITQRIYSLLHQVINVFWVHLAPLLLIRNADAQHLSSINLERVKWRIMPVVFVELFSLSNLCASFHLFLKSTYKYAIYWLSSWLLWHYRSVIVWASGGNILHIDMSRSTAW